MLIVKAKIRDFSDGLSIAGDFVDELDKKAQQLIKDACERAKGNGRKTVMAKDL